MEIKYKIYQSYYLTITAIVLSVIWVSGFYQMQKVMAEPNLIDFYKFMDKGKALYESRNFTGASIYFEKALDIDPMDTDALMYMGYSLSGSGRPALALEYYDKVLSIDPENHIKLSKEKDQSTLILHEERMELYDQKLAINPTDKEAILDKGIQFKDIGKYSEAIKYIDEALTVDPTDPMILNERGDVIFSLGNYSEAINNYKKILTVYPNEQRALASIGNVLYNMGNYSGAMEYFNQVLSLDPNYSYFYTTISNNLVADILKTMDNDTAALYQLDKYLISYPNSTDTLREKGLIYLTQGNYSEAIKIYDKILAIDPAFRFLSGDPKDLSTLEIKGYILSTIGNDTGAIESFDQVLESNPNDLMTLTLKGNALLNLGVYDGAIAYYDKVLKIHPDNIEVTKLKLEAQNAMS